MHRLNNLSSSSTFLQYMNAVIEYLSPMREMWPLFWLKAAAAYDGEAWHLCYLALVGRWSEVTSAEPVWEQGDALLVVSKRLDAVEAWALLSRLATDGVVELSPSVIAHVADVSVGATEGWQVQTPNWTDHTIDDVVEKAEWRWLHDYGSVQWLTDWSAKDALYKRIYPDLERLGLRSYQSLINNYLGSGEERPNEPGVDMFQYRLDLPLALLVSLGVPDPSQHTWPLAVAVRPPLTMDTLIITSGNRPSAAHAQVPIVDQQASHDGWTIGSAVIPSSDSKVWLAHPLVYRRLLFEIPLPTSAAQVADTIACIYAPTKPSKGEEIWTSDLLKGQSHRFEVAFLNALVRFGIPVLFSGQFQQTQPVNNITGDGTSRQATGTMTSTKQPKASGPATPGFDLIALDPRHKRAVLISAKGITRSPGDDDIENLVVGVERVSRMLEGWQVSGLIACHASATRLVRVRQRDDIVVWGQEELAMLLTADTPDPIYRMLWAPPGWQRLDIFRGHLY